MKVLAHEGCVSMLAVPESKPQGTTGAVHLGGLCCNFGIWDPVDLLASGCLRVLCGVVAGHPLHPSHDAEEHVFGNYDHSVVDLEVAKRYRP